MEGKINIAYLMKLLQFKVYCCWKTSCAQIKKNERKQLNKNEFCQKSLHFYKPGIWIPIKVSTILSTTIVVNKNNNKTNIMNLSYLKINQKLSIVH